MAIKPGSQVAYQEIGATDMDDPRLAKLNALLLQIVQAVNYSLGYSGQVVLVAGLKLNGDLQMQNHNVTGFSQLTPGKIITITGSKGGNVALASLITALADLGLVIDKTT
jgi:hypothetical protein